MDAWKYQIYFEIIINNLTCEIISFISAQKIKNSHKHASEFYSKLLLVMKSN
jgi:hypothetical protein